MTPNPQYPGQPYGVPNQRSGLATAAFVCALVGIPLAACGIGVLLELVALGLGIGALVQISNTPGLGGRGFAITAIVLPSVFLVVGMIGVMAAGAIPNFIRFQARSKQAECKSNLKSVYTAEQSFYAEKQAYSTNTSEIGFGPQRGNRYAYFLFDVGQLQDRSTARTGDGPGVTGIGVDTFKYQNARPLSYSDVPALAGGAKAGVHGQCPDCSFVAVCAGNIDQDEALDVWSISSTDRTGKKGETIPGGVPYNDVNDVTE